MGGGNGSAYLVVATDTAHRHVHNWMNRGGNEYRSDNGNKDVAGKRTKVTAKDAWTNVEVEAGVGKTGLSLDSIASHDSAFLVLTY